MGITGLVGIIHGNHPGPCIGLRADMDGLPLHEAESEFNGSYISQEKGCMHGCGHDGHMAMLLGAAKVLAAERQSLHGSVKLIFQPNEENVQGALAQIKEGVMSDGSLGPKVDEVYGIHLIAAMPTGVVGVRDGPLMAASDKIRIVIRGPGGHGGMAAGVPDTIAAASHLVSQLQTIVSRTVEPNDPAVLSICYIRAGDGGYNVMPSELEMRGTVRNFSNRVQSLIKQRIEDLCAGVSRSFSVSCESEYASVTPCTDNASGDHVQHIRQASQRVVGKERTVSTPPVMGAEDFSEVLTLAFTFRQTTDEHSPLFIMTNLCSSFELPLVASSSLGPTYLKVHHSPNSSKTNRN